MDREQFARFAMALKTYYPRDGLLPNNEALNLWFIQLQDLDYKVVELSLNKWVAVNKWPPTIADIRETAANIVLGDAPDWGEGWQQVLKAIGVYGMYRQQDALDSMDDITRQCVERIGWWNICTSENPSADRANFRMMYEATAERQKREMQLPQMTRAQISQIRSAALEDKGGV